MTIEDRTFRKWADAAEHLQRLLAATATAARRGNSPPPVEGTLAGLAIQACVAEQFGDVVLAVRTARIEVICDREEFLHADRSRSRF